MKWFVRYFPKLWTREKPDGRKGWGALRYFIIGGLFFVAGLWCVHRLQQGNAQSRAANFVGRPAKPANPAAGNVRIKELAEAAQDTRPIEIKGSGTDTLAQSQVGMTAEQASATPQVAALRAATGTEGYFGETSRGAPRGGSGGNGAPSVSSSSNDSIMAALMRSDQTSGADGRPAVEEDNHSGAKRSPGSARSGFQQPTLVNNNYGPVARNNPQQMPPIESLVVKDQRPTPTGGGPNAGGAGQAESPPTNRFLPRGEIIPVYLMQRIETGKFPTLVHFAAAKTIWFNGKPAVPFGTRFMATAGLGVRDRITFNVDSLRRRDGLEIACHGMVLGTDRSTGIRAYYIPPPAMAQAAPYVASFAQAYADLMKLRVNPTTIQIGPVGVTTQRSAGQETQEAIIGSASQALSDFMASQLAELKERYPGYLTVPEGSTAYVQLTENTDFTALWDQAPRGTMRTVGKPEVVSTESVYRQREFEKAPSAAFANMLSSVSSGASASAPPSTANNQPAAAITGRGAATPIKDPLAR